MSVSINSKGKSHASSLISSGKVSDAPWGFSGEDGDKLLGPDGNDWAEFSKWFLGEDTSETENTKARWKYPFGKSGTVYVAALKAIEGRATQQGAATISDAASKLLEAARPGDEKGKKSASVTEETVETREVVAEHTRDAADGDPLPGEPGYDPDDDGDDDSMPNGDTDNDQGMRLCRSGMAHARALVKAGKVSHGPFTFDAEDRANLLGPNGTHTSELARHHLGSDASQGDRAKAPAYPFAKQNVAYSRAFRSIARRAAVDGHDGIAAAATELMAAAAPPDGDGGDEAPASQPPAKKGRSARPHQAHAGGFKHRVLPFEVSRTTDDGSYFEGYAAILNNVDEYKTIMCVGCFDTDIDQFRQQGFLGGLNHNWDEPIGSPSVVRVDRRGLFVGGDVIDTTHGLDVRKLLRAGVVKKMSFGFEVVEQDWLDEPDQVMAYWNSVGYTPTAQDIDRARGGVMLFRRVKVYEASPVMVPGNALADITAVRSDDPGDGKSAAPYLTLDSHTVAVHDAVKGLCGRFVQLATLRASQGRPLAKDKASKLREIRDMVDSAEAACRPRASRSDVAALRRELYDLDISLLTPAATGTSR